MTNPLRAALLVSAVAVALLVPAGGAAAQEPFTPTLDVNYDLGSPPAVPGQNALDVYVPAGLPATARRPVVVFVHGGGWAIGDKKNNPLDKARLFTRAGYVYVSINYRLSPRPSELSNPARIKFPDHPNDVGEALGWIDRNIASYGGDSGRMALVGHSAGAHLVALMGSDPKYTSAYGVLPAQLIGIVPLDTEGYDVKSQADPAVPGNSAQNNEIYQNAFGTPAENASTNSWFLGSPLSFANADDPEFLFVTQAGKQKRINFHVEMARALGQNPETSVVKVPLDHEGINDALGNPSDTTGETQAVLGFVQRKVAEASRPVVKVAKRPAKVVRTAKSVKRVSFRFSTETGGVKYECRLDGGKFSSCKSPRSYNVGRGKHAFRVRATVPGRSPGPATVARFTVLRTR